MMKLRLDLDQLTILFVGLKLSGHISWPWWKVLVPTVISIVLRWIAYYRNGDSRVFDD